MADDSNLRAAAEEGDVDRLYRLSEEDQFVLEDMDKLLFVETPLHIAAAAGRLPFAAEIMRLKPSFASKLNQQGFSPIHLALQQGHKNIVLRFVDINKDIVRVKGREGLTPLHYVSQTGEIDLLASFLKACPDSIEDVNVRGETALHVAVNNNQYEALEVLVGWLMKTEHRGAMELEKTILNWKDEASNTILHLLAQDSQSQVAQPQVLQLLIGSKMKLSPKKHKMDLNAKNLQEFTALDLAANADIERILARAGAKCGSSVTDARPLVDKLRSKTTGLDKMVIFLCRVNADLSEDRRNAYLVVATLVATAIYQAALSPPGGVYQANADAKLRNAGKSVMPGIFFPTLSSINTLSLMAVTMTIFILMPVGHVGFHLLLPMLLFVCSYILSVQVISPHPSSTASTYGMLFLFGLSYIMLHIAMSHRESIL